MIMKKNSFYAVLAVVALAVMAACKSKQAEPAEAQKAEQTVTSEPLRLAPEHLVALIDADWDAVPQDLLDKMGMKALKSFKKEFKEAQVDNLQYYFGRGASVELDNEGQPVKITAENENAVVLYLTAESVAYGTIAFRSEADYNEFMKKTGAKAKDNAEEEIVIEYEGKGMNTAGDEPGYEKGKWFFVRYIADK